MKTERKTDSGMKGRMNDINRVTFKPTFIVVRKDETKVTGTV